MISDDEPKFVGRQQQSQSAPRRGLQQPLLGEERGASDWLAQRPTSLRYDTWLGNSSSARPPSTRPVSISVISTAGAAALLNAPEFLHIRAELHGEEAAPTVSGVEDDEKAPTPPTRDKTMLAIVLILATDVVATLQSTALKVLRERGYGVFNLLLVSSVVGLLFAASVLVVRGTPVRPSLFMMFLFIF